MCSRGYFGDREDGVVGSREGEPRSAPSLVVRECLTSYQGSEKLIPIDGLFLPFHHPVKPRALGDRAANPVPPSLAGK